MCVCNENRYFLCGHESMGSIKKDMIRLAIRVVPIVMSDTNLEIFVQTFSILHPMILPG